jgi:hypothetical protein
MKKYILAVGLALVSISAPAELIQQFKSPSFNGQNWSSHVLTIDSIEKNRSDAIESQRKADAARALSDQQNTPLNRFVSLFQSQVYSQLSTQLSNNLFRDNCKGADGAAIPGCVNPTTGTFSLDGNTVTWNKSATSVTLTVVDGAGSVTRIVVPIASFAF